MKRLIFFAFVLFLPFSAAFAQSPFAGTIDLNQYTVDESGNENLTGTLTMMLNADRIYLSSIGGVDAVEEFTRTSMNHALIRHDHRDILLFGDDEQALKINREELQALVNMLDNLQEQLEEGQEHYEGLRFNETGEQDQIEGYQATKWEVTGREGDSYHVWLTDEISVNWGLLAEDWMMQMAGSENLPVQEWLQDGQTPLVVKHFEQDKLTSVMKIENINPGNVDQAKLETPENKEILTFQQIMMRRFQGN